MTDIALRLVQFRYDDDLVLAITVPEVLREGAEEIKKLRARVKELEGDRAQLKDGYTAARNQAFGSRMSLALAQKKLEPLRKLWSENEDRWRSKIPFDLSSCIAIAVMDGDPFDKEE